MLSSIKDRPKFNVGAYGKPASRSAQKLAASNNAQLSVIDQSEGYKSAEPHIECKKVAVAQEKPTDNGLAPKSDATQDVSIVTISITVCPEAKKEPFVTDSPSTNTADTSDAVETASAAPLARNETYTHLEAQAPTATATAVPSLEAWPSFTTASTLERSHNNENGSAPDACAPKSDIPAKVWQAERSSQPQAHNTRTSWELNPRINRTVEAMSTHKKSGHTVAKDDRWKQLQAAQADSLKEISRKTAVRNIKHANSSVSIRDLDLARAPVRPDKPESSFRKWAQDSPLYTVGYEEGSVAFTSLHKEISIEPLAPSTRASHAQGEGLIASASGGPRRSKWAVKDEMKAEKLEAGSNDFGSEIPSDATQASNMSDESFGKLLRRQVPAQDESLLDWRGKMMPPPADWAERPRYNNNNPDFKIQFKNYVGELQGRFSSGIPIATVPVMSLLDMKNHPDGIGMVSRSKTIDSTNAIKYGYPSEDFEEFKDVVKYARRTDDTDFEAQCKLDPNDEGNASHDPEETTEKLVTNWLKHLANARGESIQTGTIDSSRMLPPSGNNEPSMVKIAPTEEQSLTGVSEDDDGDEAAPLTVPTLNIYLRPATMADLSELTRIYNWYVINGSQPSELREVDEAAMEARMKFCAEGKLPFIVAAHKSQKNAKRIPIANDEEFSQRRRLPVTHKQHMTLTRIEKLAGFCCANDFSQPDFVEHITADIEIYIDAQFRKMGVGKCLMDKMLHICDRGHRLTMDVPFHCDQEVRHMYEAGGVRDLHKMIINLRKWHTPKSFAINVHANRKPRKLPLGKTAENDYNQWMKEWLESYGFEEEGFLKKMGAKNGRYIDVVYLCRATSWEPPEGKVPDPMPDFMNAYEMDENGDGY